MSKDNMITRTHKDYTWPRTVPILVKPAQPPLWTGVRLYCPEPEQRNCFCKQDDYQDYRKRPDTSQIREKSDDDVRMSRKKFMLLNKNSKNFMEKYNKYQSTQQFDFPANDPTFDDLMHRSTYEDSKRDRIKWKITKVHLDPIPFKKISDSYPLLG